MPALTITDLVALETRIWEALQFGDLDSDAEHLAGDFLGVYPTGFASKADHVDQLRGGPTVERFELTNTRMTVLTSDHVLLSYKATFRRPRADRSEEQSMWISSLWSLRQGRWQNTFSQDTPV